MRISIFTADYAQADEHGKLNAIGLGWTRISTPLPAHSLAVIFEVDWSNANEVNDFVIELVDADGNLLITAETGEIVPIRGQDPEECFPLVRIDGQFEVGRPPGLIRGTPLTNAIAINLAPGMPLSPGRYTYRVMSGDVTAGYGFSVIEAPAN